MKAWIFFTIVAVIYFGLNYVLKTEKGWPGNKRFHDLIAPSAGDSATSFYKLMVVASLLVLLVFGVAAFHWDNTEKLGTFGDFVGGVVNPILTFFTFVGLLITIVLQQKAAASADLAAQKTTETLNEQLRSQKRQSFETTFFQMLTLHNTIVNSMDIKKVSNPKFADVQGRDCFRVFYDDLRRYYVAETANGPDDLTNIRAAYKRLWKSRQQDLGHYFRYLYNVIRFTHEANVDDRYMKLLRAQLSDYELVILLYNSLTDAGHNFRMYIDHYNLMDNLSEELLFDPSHWTLLDEGALTASIQDLQHALLRAATQSAVKVVRKRVTRRRPETKRR